jgi:hypothetical protein
VSNVVVDKENERATLELSTEVSIGAALLDLTFVGELNDKMVRLLTILIAAREKKTRKNHSQHCYY